jgi:fructose 1,6-bisphosphate aldolase/phosphatase
VPPEKQKLTMTVVSADVGGFVGNITSHPEVLDTAKERLFNAREKGLITDFHVLRCGDGLGLAISHYFGPENKTLRDLLWNTLNSCVSIAKELKLHNAGAGFSASGSAPIDSSADGPVITELTFTERPSEPVIFFFANKTCQGAWNLPLYKIFADPFNTAGLIMDAEMSQGFTFKILDLKDGAEIAFSTPSEVYALLAVCGITSRYVITSVRRNTDNEIAASVTSRSLRSNGGLTQASRSNPAMLIRCQTGLPSVGEALEAFAAAHLVGGWMRESYNGPLMPVPFYEANPSRFDGPPRVIGAGFQITDGRLIGPHDMFDDPSFDETRRLANQITDYMRRHGPFEPHRLPKNETTGVKSASAASKLKERQGR